MPGLLSHMFDGGNEGGSSTDAYAAGAALDLAQDIDLELAVDVGLEAGGSYENLDGSTTTWSNSQDIELDADVGGTLTGVLGTDMDHISADSGG